MSNPIAVLDDLEDVAAPAPDDGDVLTYDEASGLWKPMAAPPAGYTHGARVYHDVPQNIPNTTLTALAFNSERYDVGDLHDNVDNNSRLTCKEAGKYIIVGNIYWQSDTGAGKRSLRFKLNDTTYIAHTEDNPTEGSWAQSLATIYELALNDYVELVVYHNKGAVIAVNSISNYSPEFMMQRIG